MTTTTRTESATGIRYHANAMDAAQAENRRLTTENADLRRQLESARGIAARVFEASDCDCVFTTHPATNRTEQQQ